MEKPRVVAIIQARMGSTRLPGKTLAKVAGKPLLEHVINRVKASRNVDEIVVATTTEPRDRVIVRLAGRCGVQAYTGSEQDVLDRYYQAAKRARADIIVRVTGDDPFQDPEVIDKVVECMLGSSGLDYVSNWIEPTYPEGLDVEAFSFETLERAWQEAKLPSEREHVTPYIWKNPDKFRLANIKHHTDLAGLRWTVDYEEDLQFVREVYSRLYHKGIFHMDDVLELLQTEPELATINQGIERQVGYTMSLMRDREGCQS